MTGATDKLVIIDGNSLINRAYYALPPMITKSGEYTNAVYGFLNMLIKVITDVKPKYVGVCFDLPAPTFRHKMYDGYKATRKGMPDDLASQMPILKNILKEMNIKILELAGFEADDIIGTMSKRFSESTIIVTGDRDCLQLIDDSTAVWLTKRGLSEVAQMDEKALLSEFGVTPAGIIELKSLQGDSSDNIPGVAGVGEKTARDLVTQYGTLDNVYKNLDSIKDKLREKLVLNKDTAYLSRQLATINTDVDLPCSAEDLTYTYPFSAQVRDTFARYEFRSLLKREDIFSAEAATVKPAQLEITEKNIDNLVELRTLLATVKEVMSVCFCDDIYIAADMSTEYKVVINKDLFGGNIEYCDAISAIKPVLENDSILKVVFDYKSLLKRLNGRAGAFKQRFDIQLAQYMCEIRVDHDTLENWITAAGYNKKYKATSLLSAYYSLKDSLEREGMTSLFTDIELPLQEVLFDMENEGFHVDVKMADELKIKYNERLKILEEKIYALAGEQFNINSPKQLAGILFGKLGFESGKKSKTGGFSTSVDILENLTEHGIVREILEYRSVSKLLSTYIEGLVRLVKSDGTVHTDFKQTVTTTGRLSSTEPNLQNIPVRDEEGRILRKLFTARPDYTLIVADYSQIELRLLAHFSHDAALNTAYKECRDIHTHTAGLVNNVEDKDVTSEMRRSAKAVNFGIIYGISDFGLAKQLGISVNKAKQYIAKYFETYAQVKKYLNGVVEEAKRQGKLSTLCGRVRYFPELKSSNFNIRSFGERAAMNMPLQGTAADLIKIAMINVHKSLKGMKSKLILQVHDELIVDTHPQEIEEVKTILKRDMEQAVLLSVPLAVDIGEGINWYEAK